MAPATRGSKSIGALLMLSFSGGVHCAQIGDLEKSIFPRSLQTGGRQVSQGGCRADTATKVIDFFLLSKPRWSAKSKAKRFCKTTPPDADAETKMGAIEESMAPSCNLMFEQEGKVVEVAGAFDDIYEAVCMGGSKQESDTPLPGYSYTAQVSGSDTEVVSQESDTDIVSGLDTEVVQQESDTDTVSGLDTEVVSQGGCRADTATKVIDFLSGNTAKGIGELRAAKSKAKRFCNTTPPDADAETKTGAIEESMAPSCKLMFEQEGKDATVVELAGAFDDIYEAVCMGGH